jgi:hypothetical protein
VSLKVSSKNFLRRVRRAAIWRSEDMLLQWLWFAFGVEPEHIGYGRGPLTWLKKRKHKRTHRKVHLCLLEHNPKGWPVELGELTAFWINERSRVCSASLNEGIEDADVVWIYSQDPLSPDIENRLLRSLQRAGAATPVINHPDVYGSYHEEGAFTRLAEAGVGVPRTEFSESDVGKTWVVYKSKGKHTAPKFLTEYAGPRAGYRTFEFVDSRGPDGLYRVYRTFYLLGSIHPYTVMFGEDWNVYPQSMSRREYTFSITPFEARQIRLIAETLGIQYFAVDYLRREQDGLPIFTDVNVYPDIDFRMRPMEIEPIRWIAKALGMRYFAADYLRRERDGRLVYLDVNVYPKSYPALSLRESGIKLGYYGSWLTFDRLKLFGICDPSERPFWDMFDEAMLRLASKEPLPVHQHESNNR